MKCLKNSTSENLTCEFQCHDIIINIRPQKHSRKITVWCLQTLLRSLFVLLSFFFWPLYCPSFNLWLLIYGPFSIFKPFFVVKLHLYVQSVAVTTKIVCLNPAYDEVKSFPLYMINFISYLLLVKNEGVGTLYWEWRFLKKIQNTTQTII